MASYCIYFFGETVIRVGTISIHIDFQAVIPAAHAGTWLRLAGGRGIPTRAEIA
jgi:hypothetical protein